MKINKVTDPEFRKYGRVIDGYDFSKLIKAMEHTPLPEDVIYEPSIEELEATDVAIDLKMRIYGELPIQIGYCNGHNSKLNALEYHRSSEVNVAVTDIILLLGAVSDIPFRAPCADMKYSSTSRPSRKFDLIGSSIV